MAGPLTGVRVLEVAAIGPVPFAGMLLSDLGAEVVRVDRPGSAPFLTPIDRGRRSVAVDLKQSAGTETVLRLAERADILLEGFRPGVMERLGLGPAEVLARNQRLVYARMTGFGQSGPLAQQAGHDINYVALSGALELIGPAEGPPLPPLNLLGDFGGGGMLLVSGVLAALHHATATGQGQVVDAAMVDGVSALMAMHFGLRARGMLGPRGGNGLDGGAPYYRTFATADGRWMAVGAIEEPFYLALLAALELDPATVPDRNERGNWPELHGIFEAAFLTRTRDDWADRFAGFDACVTPVLSPHEVERHPQHQQRGGFVEVDGVLQPAPAPRLSATQGEVQGPPPLPGAHTRDVLRDWGFPEEEIAELHESATVRSPGDVPASR